MKIQVLGSGCPTCKKLYEITEKAVAELGLDIKVDYVNDVQKIISLGVMQSPVLVVNDKPALAGFTLDIGKIKKAIQDNI
jgi:small redox-active disulfide protein 2